MELHEYRIDITDGELFYIPGFLPPDESNRLFNELQQTIDWTQPIINLFGHRIASPRLAAWYGDPDTRYTYSGLTNEPLPWLTSLSDLRQRLETFTGNNFNSVLANLYRDGNDSMGWHSDDEPELRRNPTIASLSLGSRRRFRLKHKRLKTNNTISLGLDIGSLLLMMGDLQHHWRHCIPKSKTLVSPRINLTFRKVSHT